MNLHGWFYRPFQLLLAHGSFRTRVSRWNTCAPYYFLPFDYHWSLLNKFRVPSLVSLRHKILSLPRRRLIIATLICLLNFTVIRCSRLLIILWVSEYRCHILLIVETTCSRSLGWKEDSKSSISSVSSLGIKDQGSWIRCTRISLSYILANQPSSLAPFLFHLLLTSPSPACSCSSVLHPSCTGYRVLCLPNIKHHRSSLIYPVPVS